MEKEYFEKIFVYPTTLKQQFQVFQKNAFDKPTFDHWLHWSDNYKFYYGQIKPYRLNPQYSYFAERITFTKKYSCLGAPFSGLEFLTALSYWNKKHPIIYNRIQKILQLTADISVNSVANPTFFVHGLERVHPGKNLVSAHQILGKPLNCIVAVNNSVDTNKYQNFRQLKNLKDIADCFENIPMGFIENSHIHFYCLHGNYNKLDSNGYAYQPSFDTDRFINFLSTELDSEHRVDIYNSKGNKVNIPIVYDKKVLNNFFKKVYEKDFTWEKSHGLE